MRLFIALELPKEIKSSLSNIIDDLNKHCSDRSAVKWVNPKNSHLTLKFLGETDKNLIENIKEDISKAGQKFQSINCKIIKIGGFPNLIKPRVIWSGLETENDDLINLAEKIDHLMSQHGFEKENRRFKAHLTLGRVRGRDIDHLTDYMQSYKFDEIPLVLNKLCLFKSTLTPNGPIYDKLHEIILGEERFE